MVSDAGHLPKVRFPQITTLAWEAEFSGVRAVISRELGAGSAIALDDCELKGIKLSPKEGGSVEIEFKIISHPSTDLIGRLAELQQHEVLVTIEQGAIRQEQGKADKRATKVTLKDGTTADLLQSPPKPEGGWPFATNWEQAHKKLNAAGYAVDESEVKKWTGEEVTHVIAFCDSLGQLKKGGALPKAPPILKGRYRGKASTTAH